MRAYISPFFCYTSYVGVERATWGVMEERVGADEMARVGGERDDEENTRERLFTVGEVVEFWEGSVVRGYRRAPDEPAFVKSVGGNGLYLTKMVGSCSGKFRVVGMKTLFVGQTVVESGES